MRSLCCESSCIYDILIISKKSYIHFLLGILAIVAFRIISRKSIFMPFFLRMSVTGVDDMKILYFIREKVSWKCVLFLLLTSAVLSTFIMTMFFGQLHLNPDAVMDSLSYYNSDMFFSNLATQGHSGRISYLYLHVIDYLFITQFYTFFVFLIYMLSRRFINSRKNIEYLCMVPLIPALMDLLENISIDTSIFLYPEKIPVLGTISGIFTFVKMYSIYVVFIILMVLLCMQVVSSVLRWKIKRNYK